MEVTRRSRGGVKRGETNLASNQFPMLSTVWNTQRGSQSYTEKKEEGDRGDQKEKRGSQKGRDQCRQ